MICDRPGTWIGIYEKRVEYGWKRMVQSMYSRQLRGMIDASVTVDVC